MESILFMHMMRCLTPDVNAIKVCSLVFPVGEIPRSNSPFDAEIRRTAASAYEVPVIILPKYLVWPGVSTRM